jgi:retinol dehydrogenase-12
VMFCPFQLSKDGVEMQFATNHLGILLLPTCLTRKQLKYLSHCLALTFVLPGHFLLTNLLLDNMKATAKSTGIEGRIVILSSVAHTHTYPKGIDFDRINDEKKYNDKMAYGQSKLANLLHANELSRRLKEEGANITVNSIHPGLIMTNLMRHSYVLLKIIQVATFILWKNVHQGAATTCYVGLNPQLRGVTGQYFADCNVEKTSKLAKSDELAKQLWDFSEELIRSAQ